MTARKRKIIAWFFWVTILSPVVIVFLYLLFIRLFADIPSFEELEDPNSKLATLILDENGKVLTTFHLENRTAAEFEDLSPYLLQAAVSTEDRRYFEHSGIDVWSLPRVALKTIALRKSSQGGGSTITQQLAKNLYKTRKDMGGGHSKLRMVNTKFKEWVTAIELEKRYTKEEIFTMYMNTYEFGHSQYGINSASETFFSKPPKDLNIQEAAVMVAMLNKASAYDPVSHPGACLQRRNFILSKMCGSGFLTEHQCDSIKALPIELDFHVKGDNSGVGLYFKDMLRRTMKAGKPERSNYNYVEDFRADSLLWETDGLYGWLEKNPKPDGSLYNLDTDGLRIHTSLNYNMQKYAEEAVAEHLGKNLQKSFEKECRSIPASMRPFSAGTTKDVVDLLMKQARRNSDRFRNMRKRGVSENEILKSFDRKVKMRVFSWNSKGYADTLMTPNDSIRYYKGILRAAFIAIEPMTGNVKAYVGGPNYRYFKYDNVRQGKRQVGSTAKPFLYTLAMQEGMSPCHRVVNVPQTFDVVGTDQTWTPKSTDKPEWIGQSVTLKWGLMKSSNNISAYLMKQFGPEAMVQMMRRMGISSHLESVYSLCVGSCDLSLFEMVSAYNTFPSHGMYVSPILVTSIEDKNGNVISSFSNRKKEAISEQSAYLMINLMEGVVNSGTAVRLRSLYALKGDIAGKTGTNTKQEDGWFIGYTPKITAGVWVGAEDRQVHFRSLALGGGSNMALPIWGIFMKKCINDGTLGLSSEDVFEAPADFEVNLDCGEDIIETASSSSGAGVEEDYFE